MQLSTLTSQSPLPRPHKSQLPSFHRADHPPRFQITGRDKQILLRVYYYRRLTAQQIEALLFYTSSTTRGLKTQCQRRLQLLYHHAYLDRLQLPVLMGHGRQSFVYGLGRQGAQVIAAELSLSQTDVDWHPRHNQVTDPYHLEHDLANNDLWVILDRLAQAKAVEMPYWLAQHHLLS